MKQIRIYTIDHCPYCEKALRLLKKKGVFYENIILPNFQCAAYKTLSTATNMDTLPQIFIAHRLIGGYSALQRLENSGELDRLVQ